MTGAVMFFSLNLFAGNFLSLTSDAKIYNKGDLIKVLVSENTRAGQQASMSTSRYSDAKGNLNADIGPLSLDYSMDEKGSASAKGGGSIESASFFNGNLTAQVEEILPSGNLRIKGERLIKVDGEEKKIILSGIVDPRDIKTGNRVFSYEIHELSLSYDGKGVIKKRQKRGFLNFLLGWIF